MKNGILKNVTIPIYRVVINVMIHDDCDKAVQLSKRLTEEFYEGHDWKSMHGAYVRSNENNIHAIVLAEDADINTVTHECFHATMAVLQCKGIVYCEESEECFAYVLGYLTDIVWKLLTNYKSK